ncbi:NlpC/P60 family protein [Carboxydochorda subterranea]|uniref:NlpC/P60 family protein n=1 Tax=Carboxydichorda subterranea TaxID=3109565 RepID=A0ABZ1BVV7_9FIRM|nr:NlpC/P60 family protein [Limnochorda sp. L945t]WRP16728.1 NlpC/P60 family protein [Limnochorda sp. L945t]
MVTTPNQRDARRPVLRRARVTGALLLVALLAGLAGTQAAAQEKGAASGAAPAGEQASAGVVIGQEPALSALRESLRYVEAGVPFRLGGKTTVDEYLRLQGSDPRAAASAGVDASGLVVNALRAAVPGVRFFAGPPDQGRTAEYVTSAMLRRYNSTEVSIEEARPGDLLFFKSPSTGQVTGVGIVHVVMPGVVRVVVASASQGRVVETGIRIGGAYWASQVDAVARLVLPPGVTAAAAESR